MVGLVAVPAKLQNELKQFQRLQGELQAVAQQRLQFDLKLRETTHTLEELKTVGTEAPIYRPIGSLLVRAKDKAEVETLLTEEKETLEVRLKAVERQESQLKERYTSMQRELSESIRAAGLTTDSGVEGA